MSVEKRDGQFLWVEAYRPQTVESCILPERIKSFANEIANQGQLMHLLFSGPPGCGKTTLARALCNQMGLDYLLINASENGNIDTLRTTIRSFASTVSFKSDYKVVILDEADSLTSQTMSALRGFLEEFANNCRFIFTCNFPNKIIDPIKSRCTNIDFNFSTKEKQKLVVQFDRRVKGILESESIEYDKKHLAQLIMKHFPDFRRVLNELQRFTRSGKLEDSVESVGGEDISELFSYLKDSKKWFDMRKWCAAHAGDDVNLIFRALYNRANEFLQPSSIPQLVLHISEYQYRAGFVADPEINLVACLTSISADCEFK